MNSILIPTFDNKTSIETYKQKHPFKYGSTIVIQNIRDEIISTLDESFYRKHKT